MWVRAIETYGRIYRQIAPKRERLQEANDALVKKQATLKESQQKLQEVKDKLADLTRQYEEKLAYKEKLRSQIDETELKLVRAQQLMSGLSGEKARYVFL
jgi:dynein heavy chain